jgi:O-acetyl-ADP-ribose deacetylase (regulator of RNase III)
MERIRVVRADITQLEVDAIVSAANSRLAGGGGVDGAIHRAAGPSLLEECLTLGGCPTGSAKVTKGYLLPAAYVIHAVGPIWQGGTQGEAEQLASCHITSLELAAALKLKTIAFPAISCGVYSYPPKRAAAIAVTSVATFLQDHSEPEEVLFACFDDRVYRAFCEALNRL